MSKKTAVRRPRQARSRATVEAILEGTAQVLRAEGLEGCTTSKIAKRAGVSVGTLYQYFPHKEAVYEALIDRLLATQMAARAELIQAEPETYDLGPAISSLIDSLLAIHRADPTLQHQLHRYEAAAGFARLEVYQRQLQVIVAEQLRRHAEHFRPLNPELSARFVVLSMTGVVVRLARETPDDLDLPAVRRELVALLAGYLSPLNPVEGLDP